jgi:heme oxygenase
MSETWQLQLHTNDVHAHTDRLHVMNTYECYGKNNFVHFAICMFHLQNHFTDKFNPCTLSSG